MHVRTWSMKLIYRQMYTSRAGDPRMIGVVKVNPGVTLQCIFTTQYYLACTGYCNHYLIFPLYMEICPTVICSDFIELEVLQDDWCLGKNKAITAKGFSGC